MIKLVSTAPMLEPAVTLSQEPAVTPLPAKIEPVVIGGLALSDEEKHRQAFADRLNQLLDKIGIPPKGKGRQVAAGKLFEVSQKAARKWLEGESLPENWRIPEMAAKLSTTENHLMWGTRATTLEVAEPGAAYRPNLYHIPQLDVGGSMGFGRELPDHVDIVNRVTVDLPQLRREISFSAPTNLRIITGYGDSMEPTFKDGDPLLVDTGVTDIRIDGVYVLERDRQLFIKRVQRNPIDGTLIISSDNKNYQPIVADPQRVTFGICGRVLLAWNSRRL